VFKWMRSRRTATSDGDEPTGMDRRDMLRLGGMAALGTAGAAVVSVAGATSADAAAGAKMVLGAPNDAGTSATTLSSATTAETLRVSNVANGGALSVEGVAAFSRSGIATVPAGQRVVTVNVPGGLSESSGAIALLQGNGALVGAAIPDPATGTLAIWTIGPRAFPSKVAWFVFG
jgi:hypothetical protein